MTGASQAVLAADYAGDARLSPLEAEVLTAYQELARTLRALEREVAELAHGESADASERLRTLERKLDLVMTMFKLAVYVMFRQQQQ